jgi:hypothetical protein
MDQKKKMSDFLVWTSGMHARRCNVKSMVTLHLEEGPDKFKGYKPFPSQFLSNQLIQLLNAFFSY